MPFGYLAPLPFRLGDSEAGGVNASEHARLCADLAAVSRTSPVFRMRFRIANTGTPTITILSYVGRNGIGPQFAPMVVFDDPMFFVRMSDQTNSMGFPVDVATHVARNWFARVTNVTTGEIELYEIYNQYTLSIWGNTYAGMTHDYDVTVYGSTAQSHIGDYGGHLNKRNSETEGNETYAWQWYETLKNSLGSAYTKSDTSVLSWELKAHARAFGTSQRISEMLAASSAPHGSDAKLGRWATIQAVQQVGLPKWRIRELCEAQYGDHDPANKAYIEAGLTRILGTVFDEISVNVGTVESPPQPTFWPGQDGVPAGDGIYDLGNGTWMSARSVITIVVRQGALTDAELQDLMTREVEPWLDSNLSATTTWQWSTSYPGGFLLGTSKLGLNSL